MNFNLIPSLLLTPGAIVEVDGSRAKSGPGLFPYRALLVGQKIAAGSATANTVHLVSSADDVVALAGRGSQLHRMALAWFAANKSTEVFIGVLEDNGAGVAATKTITVTGPSTAAGTISLYIGGNLVQVAVTSGQSADSIAAAIDAAIDAATDLPVTSNASTNVVTLTAKNAGAVGQELDVRVNYVQGQALPAGVSLAFAAVVSGVTNPVLTSLITALGDTRYHVIAHPYTDATSLTALENELSDRMGPLRAIEGQAITAKHDSYANMITLGGTRNSAHSTILRTDDSPTPPAEYAAHVAGVVALYAENEAGARPFQTLPLPYIKAPAPADRDTAAQRRLLLAAGIATCKVGAGDMVQIERLVTTYKTNAAGSADSTFRDANTLFQLMYARENFRTKISAYSRHKLGGDSTAYPAGEAIMTPSLGRAIAVSWFKDMSESSPVVFDPSALGQFKADLVVELDATDQNRMNFLLPPNLINMLIVSAAQIQFRE